MLLLASVLQAASSTAAPAQLRLAESLSIAAVNCRHHFDRAVTHLLNGGASGRAAYSAYRHQLCCKAAKLQLGPRLLKQVRWNTNTRCGRVLTALKAAATAATRTPHSRRALREARNRRAQHAGRRNTTRKQSRVHQNANNAAAARDERTSIGNLSDVK